MLRGSPTAYCTRATMCVLFTMAIVLGEVQDSNCCSSGSLGPDARVKYRLGSICGT